MAAKRGAGRARKMSEELLGTRSERPVELAEVRERIKNLVGNAAVEMVASGIKEANKGHYAAMKFLFELVGLYPASEGGAQGAEEDGLAKALLGRLGVVEADAEVTNVLAAKPGSSSDAVE